MNYENNKTTHTHITQGMVAIKLLQECGKINWLEVLREIDCFRLSARIHQLRKRAYKIITKRISTMGHFGKVNFSEYYLDDASD